MESSLATLEDASPSLDALSNSDGAREPQREASERSSRHFQLKPRGEESARHEAAAPPPDLRLPRPASPSRGLLPQDSAWLRGQLLSARSALSTFRAAQATFGHPSAAEHPPGKRIQTPQSFEHLAALSLDRLCVACVESLSRRPSATDTPSR
eukprot:scaffold330_cov246-Pinguiococcus_pyrenoidosus.AAC.4